MGRLDAILERAYRRFGWRLPLVHQQIATALGGAMAITMMIGAGSVARLGRADTIALIGLGGLVATCHAAVGYFATSRVLRPVMEWHRGERSAQTAAEAWRTLHRLPMTISRINGQIALVMSVPAMIAGLALFVPLDAGLVASGLLVGLTALLVLVALGVFGLQLALRPLARDLASDLDAPPVPTGGVSVRRKLLLTVPLLALLSAFFALVLTADPGSEWGALFTSALIVGGVVLALVAPVGVLLAHSTLRPLEDLLEATERLARGDLGTRIPELSGDEYGLLARSFNQAMEGLAERERLAAENVRLLAEVIESRARIVAASDEARRRIERNIHDGAQQRLVALMLDLRMLEEAAPGADRSELQQMAAEAGTSLTAALEELRELARGLHPSILDTDGLAPALRQLATRSPVPVRVAAPDGHLPAGIEATIYYVASESLANISKYSAASEAEVSVRRRDGTVCVEIRDDGIGGARAAPGSGLAGLQDRVAALNGQLTVDSPRGGGTRVTATFPVES